VVDLEKGKRLRATAREFCIRWRHEEGPQFARIDLDEHQTRAKDLSGLNLLESKDEDIANVLYPSRSTCFKSFSSFERLGSCVSECPREREKRSKLTCLEILRDQLGGVEDPKLQL
jgi:hypothetical protein